MPFPKRWLSVSLHPALAIVCIAWEPTLVAGVHRSAPELAKRAVFSPVAAKRRAESRKSRMEGQQSFAEFERRALERQRATPTEDRARSRRHGKQP